MFLPIKLIVGLGNPGSKYDYTRHNAGFWFLDEFACRYNLTFSFDKKFNSEICRYQKGPIDCWLCKPHTYMNNSGLSVLKIANYYKIPVEQILVAHDEIDFETGIVRLKKSGGHGGHNGLRDIIQQIGDNNFYRLRIGIGHPGNKDKVVSYVLNHISDKEKYKIVESFLLALENSHQFFEQDINKLMTELNNRNKTNLS